MTRTPSTEELIAINAGVIGLTGGSFGLRDAQALAMCAQKPATAFGGKEIYPDLFSKAACILESIARNHPFIDGNKRTAFMAGLFIIEHNGYGTAFDTIDIEKTMVRIVVEKPSLKDIAAWLEKNSKLVEGKKRSAR